MYRLLHFLKKYYFVFLFIILEGLAINYYAKSTSYTRAKIQMASTSVTNGFNKTFSSVNDYFTLRKTNAVLTEEVNLLRNELDAYRNSEVEAPLASGKYVYSTAKVINNSVARQHNYFIINRGLADGVEENMAILTTDGAVTGYVQTCSERYSVCMSILNLNFRLGGKVNGKDFFGSVYWDGLDSRRVKLSDIPRYAQVEKNDTILSVHSLRFPPDSHIGIIDDIQMTDDGTFFDITVKLDADMAILDDVILVRYTDYDELNELAGEYFTDNR